MGMPEMIPVESTNIARVGYDAPSLEMHIEFNEGASYAYLKVPEFIYLDLVASPSKGSFLNRMVKGHYDYRKL